MKANPMRRLVALAVVLAFIFSGLSASTASASGCSLDQAGTVVTGIGTCTGEVTIPNGVTAIGVRAFSGATGLTGITISNSVTSIGAYAFESATALTSVTMGSGVISIGEYAFLDARTLTSIVIPNSVTSIGDGAFGDAWALANVTIGNSVRSIGIAAFGQTALTSLVIPNSVTSIAENAFANSESLTSVSFGNGLTSIGVRAFSRALALRSLVIPNNVTSIGDYAFEMGDSLTSVSIGNGVTSIGTSTFAENYRLTDVTIGKCVNSIGVGAFGGAPLQSVRFLSNVAPTVLNDAFAGAPSTARAVVNAGATGFSRDAFNKWNGLNIETVESAIGCPTDAISPPETSSEREASAKREADKQAARAEIINLFRNSGRATLRSLNQAEIFGVTSGNIDQFHTEVFALPKETQTEIKEILRIARKFEVVDKVASNQKIYSSVLQEVGLIPQDSKNKAFIVSTLRKLPAPERTSYQAIKQVIDLLMTEIQSRQQRFSEVLASIAARR
jgi:hypothetical protein